MNKNELTVHQLQGWCLKTQCSVVLHPDGTIYGSDFENKPVQTPLAALAAMVTADTPHDWPVLDDIVALEAEHLGDPAKETGIYAPPWIAAAERTLERLGYSYQGGELWQPPIGKAPAFNAPALLDQAAKHMRDRATTYDKPEGERSMAATVAAFNAIAGIDMSESEGWMFMALLKMVRDRSRTDPHRDSCEDLVAYSALYGEARLAERTASPAANDNQATTHAHG
jgi:hypothetical protein